MVRRRRSKSVNFKLNKKDMKKVERFRQMLESGMDPEIEDRLNNPHPLLGGLGLGLSEDDAEFMQKKQDLKGINKGLAGKGSRAIKNLHNRSLVDDFMPDFNPFNPNSSG